MKRIWMACIAAAPVLLAASYGSAETWNLGTGGSWNIPENWSPANVPDGVGASIVFNGAATADNPEQTANRPIAFEGNTRTVGSITFNNDLGTFTNTLASSSGSVLVLDANDDGPATINVPAAAGTGNNTIAVVTRFDDDVVATVDNVTASSAAGALNLTAAISGAGGFTKLGDGLATFGTAAKTYTGPTVIGGGRLRMSLLARAQSTSSFTIAEGGQVVFIAGGVTQSYTLGPGPLNLNGAGPTTGPFADFPGALRPDRNAAGRAYTITNDVVLQSDSLIHVASLAGTDHSLTLSGNVSGPGQLQFTAANTGDPELGRLVLTGTANTYSGGTLIRGGTVEGRTTGSLGTGNITVLSGSLLPDAGAAAVAKLLIEDTVGNNAIADTATLSLAGGKLPDVADDGYLELLTNETVGGLILGGMAQTPGTYGSSMSGADNKLDEFFAGIGILTVVPALHPGDFDADGDVDGADFVAWQTNFPKESGATLAQGDADGDGDVDGADFVVWQTNFPFTPGGGTAPVPEPSSIILLCICGVAALAGRRFKVR